MNALVTMAISDEYKAIGEVTFPLLRDYAARCGLEFYNIDALSGHTLPVWERMAHLFTLLAVYERILVAEVDVIVSPAARNVMELLPVGTFYGFDEYPFDSEHCEKCWLSAMDVWPDEFLPSRDFPKHLYNTGLMWWTSPIEHCSLRSARRSITAWSTWPSSTCACTNMGWRTATSGPRSSMRRTCGSPGSRRQTFCTSCGRRGRRWTA